MKSKRTREFRERYAVLPPSVQKQAIKAYALFRRSPDHPSLNFKPVNARPDWYSVRIGLSYRALCIRAGDIWEWFWIGSHTDYDKLLKQR